MVLPTSVYTQKLAAPSEDEIISGLRSPLCLLDADRIASDAGSPLSQNVVMLGAASAWMPLRTGHASRIRPAARAEENGRDQHEGVRDGKGRLREALNATQGRVGRSLTGFMKEMHWTSFRRSPMGPWT